MAILSLSLMGLGIIFLILGLYVFSNMKKSFKRAEADLEEAMFLLNQEELDGIVRISPDDALKTVYDTVTNKDKALQRIYFTIFFMGASSLFFICSTLILI